MGRQLKSISNGTNTYSYTYNEEGIRTSKTVNGITTNYVIDNKQIKAEYTDSYSIVYWYDDKDSVVGFFYTDKTVTNPTTEAYIYTKNALGDVTGILNSSGSLVVQYAYDAWGNVLSVSGTSASTIGAINPIRYRNYYFDDETGYYYLQSRYYSPQWHRFINVDDSQHIGETGNYLGVNAFAYCENNPIYYIDTTGSVVTPANIIGAAIGAIIGIVGGLFLGNWLADVLKLSGWKRGLFVGGVAALVGAAAAAIGYFIGPYVSKIAVELGKYITKLVIKGKIALKKLSKNAIKAIKPLVQKHFKSLGSTGRISPKNLYEKLAMEQVKSNPLKWGKHAKKLVMKDARWPAKIGWQKMEAKIITSKGEIVIHFVYNTLFGICDDFKFK